MNTKEKVLIHKGMDKVRQGEYDEAVLIYDRILEMNPENTYAWNNKGVAQFKAGRPDEAIESYNRSLQIDPGNLDALRNSGFVYRSLGRLEEALHCYELVMEAGGDETDMEAMATVLVGMGMLREALDCLTMAMNQNPSKLLEEEIVALMSMIEQKEQERKE